MYTSMPLEFSNFIIVKTLLVLFKQAPKYTFVHVCMYIQHLVGIANGFWHFGYLWDNTSLQSLKEYMH